MELHDKIMLPDLGKEAVLRSVKEAEYNALDDIIADHYDEEVNNEIQVDREEDRDIL